MRNVLERFFRLKEINTVIRAVCSAFSVSEGDVVCVCSENVTMTPRHHATSSDQVAS